MARFVRYGPSPYYGLPEGGFCASAFALIRRGPRYLLGIPRPHGRWAREWAPNFEAYDEEERRREFERWRFPSAYLYEGEHPDATLERVLRDQLRLTTYRVQGSHVHAFYDPSSRYPGKRHYDLVFAYDVAARGRPTLPPWFSRLAFVDPSTLGREDFGSAEGDLAAALGLLGRRQRRAQPPPGPAGGKR